jgi:hypothetical protein
MIILMASLMAMGGVCDHRDGGGSSSASSLKSGVGTDVGGAAARRLAP